MSARKDPRICPHRLLAFVLAASLPLTFTAHAKAAAGDLDTGFAGTGRTRVGFGFGADFAFAVAVQPDAKLVVAGSSGISGFFEGNFSVVRYDTNGVLDASFGQGGKVITPVLGSDGISQAKAVQIQADGKIVLAGSSYNGTCTHFALARYRGDGSLDRSFGDGGITITDFGRVAEGNAMVIQPDGKIVVAGFSYDSSNSGFALARYTTNGALDTTFGGTGKVVTEANNGDTRAHALALQPDGKLVVAGVIGTDMAVFRYTPSGELDTSFGTARTGMVFTHIGNPAAFSEADAVAIQLGTGTAQDPDKIIVAGHTRATPSHYVIAVVRYGLDGVPDGSFGAGGIATSDMGSGDGLGDFATAVLVQGAGLASRRIIVAGFTHIEASEVYCLARFNGSGNLDASFNGDGKVFTSFGPNENQARAMTFAPGGKLVVVGSTVVNPGNTDIALARYNLSDGSLDSSFDQDGRKVQDVSDRTCSAAGVAIQSDGKIVLAGKCYTGANYAFALARLHPNGALDPAFGVGGKVVIPFGTARAEARAVVIQPDGGIVAAGAVAAEIAVVRLLPNGALDPSFNGHGIVTTSIGTNRDMANAIALQPDGKIVVVGSSFNGANDDFAIVRYGTNGTLDPSFNLTGMATTAFGTSDDAASAVKIQTDSKIVVGGSAIVGVRADFAAVRYNTNGTRDVSFGTSGRVTTAIESQAFGLGLAIQPDGKIVLAGSATLTDVDGHIAGLDLAVARYGTNGVPDNTFGSGGVATTTSGHGQMGSTVVLQPDGKILIGGTRINADTDRFEPGVVRFLDFGVLDSSYGDEGTAALEAGDEGFSFGALAIDSLGQAVIAGSDGGIFGVARLQADPFLKILSIARHPNRHMVLTGIGVPGTRHTLQSATNLAGSFSLLGTVTNDSAGRWQYDDNGAANVPRRFYQLVSP